MTFILNLYNKYTPPIYYGKYEDGTGICNCPVSLVKEKLGYLPNRIKISTYSDQDYREGIIWVEDYDEKM